MAGKGPNNAPSDKAMRTMGGPWQPLQAPYQRLVKRIGEVNRRPWEYGPGIVQDFDPATAAGISQGTNLALSGNPNFAGATDFAGRVARGEFVGGTPGAEGLANTAVNGVYNPAYASMLNNMELANQGSGGLDYARDVVGGKYLNSNPHLDAVVNAATADVNRQLLPALEGRMAMSGRLGSNAEGVGRGDIAKKLGEVASNIRYGDYSAERDRQQAAGMALPSLLGTEVGARNAAAGVVGQEAYNQEAVRRAAAGQLSGDQYNQIQQALSGGSQLGTNFGNQFMGADRAIQYGGMNQTQAEREAAEAQDRFRYGQGAQYDKLNRQLNQYGQIVGTASPMLANQMYGGTLNRPSGFQQGVGNLLGLAGAGAQIGSMFMDKPPNSNATTTAGAGGGGGAGGAASGALSGAAMGSMFGPWGTAVGAGIGGLSGFFA